MRERIAAALRSGDNGKVDEAVRDWLDGLRTDEELADRYERDRESYETVSMGRG